MTSRNGTPKLDTKNSLSASAAAAATREVSPPVAVPARGKVTVQTSPAVSGPATVVKPRDAEVAALELLLRVEALARNAGDLPELHQVIANETRKLSRARQIFVIKVRAGGQAEVVQVSGVSAIDPRATLIEAIVALMRGIEQERKLSVPVEFSLPAYCGKDSELATTYPFREMVWLPFLDRSKSVFGGMLLARETPWNSSEVTVAGRLSDAYAHAWRELAGPSQFRSRLTGRVRWRLLAALVVMVALALPVPMSALAPVEIVAADPFVVAAPIDAVIEDVAVEPSGNVQAGDVLVRFSDTAARNRVEIARREVAVAESRVKQATILAFSESKGRHQLGIAMAELELKKAELAYAEDLLGKTVLRADRGGLAVYGDRKALIGKPVAIGERIMEIADPNRIEARIELAAPDVVALRDASAVKLFLDVDPLRPMSGRVLRSDYRARPSDTDVLSFRTYAALDSGDGPVPRIGLRGTAQVYGPTVPLAMFLFRRPLSSARQWLGL
ncbi:MAG: efflux RND transporter periplasmic adaptor subunit [Hyphomicrobiaceae bacterium]